jgi:hypothetical protein
MNTIGKREPPDFSRRRWPRLKPDSIPGLKGVELNQGSEVDIVNISRGGLLLETEARLRPDLKIMLKVVTTDGVLRLDGTILRSSIFSLKGAPRYRTAIAFKQPLTLLDDLKAEEILHEKEAIDGLEKELPAQDFHEDEEKAPAILTFVASDSSGICMQESFSLNDW